VTADPLLWAAVLRPTLKFDTGVRTCMRSEDDGELGSTRLERARARLVEAIRWFVDVFRGHAGSRHLERRER
jgi:hypothetical protein